VRVARQVVDPPEAEIAVRSGRDGAAARVDREGPTRQEGALRAGRALAGDWVVRAGRGLDAVDRPFPLEAVLRAAVAVERTAKFAGGTARIAVHSDLTRYAAGAAGAAHASRA